MTVIRLELGTFDPALRLMARPEGEVRLSPKESELLAYLAANPRRAVSHEELLREVWGYAPGTRSRTVYTTIDRLRAKIERDPAHPRHVLSPPTTGYRFEPLAPAADALAGSDLLGRSSDMASLAQALVAEMGLAAPRLLARLAGLRRALGGG